jgi:hypothetical protein
MALSREGITITGQIENKGHSMAVGRIGHCGDHPDCTRGEVYLVTSWGPQIDAAAFLSGFPRPISRIVA